MLVFLGEESASRELGDNVLCELALHLEEQVTSPKDTSSLKGSLMYLVVLIPNVEVRRGA